jgi:L-ascorbate metabolism protein UlaG (beta-lactamase superfamily)
MSGPFWCRWLGVAGLELELDGQILAIDPFFTRPPFWRLWFGRVRPDRRLVASKVQRCDHILVTHAHWDHLMDVPEVARNTGAVVLGSARTCRLLTACGVPEAQIEEIGEGDELTLGPFQVQVLGAEHLRIPCFTEGPLRPDLHPPLRLRNYRMDRCYSFSIQAGGHRLLDWRSVQVEGAPRADVLYVGPEGACPYYASLIQAVQPQVIVPIHWDDMFRSLSKPVRPFWAPPRLAFPPLQRMDPSWFRAEIEGIAPHTRVVVPEPFRRYDIGSWLG